MARSTGRAGDTGIAKLPPQVANGDFEKGLAGWHVVSGKAFTGQPATAAKIGAADVVIDGQPVVRLGGDYWHTTGYPLGHSGASLIRVVTKAPGILDSNPFTISMRYLTFLIGGSSGGSVALELRVPSATAKAKKRKALDKADADGYVAVRTGTPSGSDPLVETAWDLFGKEAKTSLQGEPAKVRLRVDAGTVPRRLLVDDVRLAKQPPVPGKRQLWGWADIHCHPMAQAGFGDLLAGHMHGPVEDVGSCLELHGHHHENLLRPVALALETGRLNDGSLATTGWTTGTPGPDAELGFRGWPAFNELTHLKTHQDWIRRAYDGGQRLMVALIVHNQMLAALSTSTKLIFQAQSDRDTVEPQVQMLREFVAHNGDWCGLAATPADARRLIGQNKLAFVLGLETDSINEWSRFTDFPQTETPATSAAIRKGIHDSIHDYFDYLHKLGVVQVNLLHLSNNAFGGMALYDVMFLVNSWARTGLWPDPEDGFTGRGPGEAISTPVSLASALWEKLAPKAQALGLPAPPMLGNGVYGHGDRNKVGLTLAGEEALLEAMRLGMVIDMDHMSEIATGQANTIAQSKVPSPPYPLVAAHNGARTMAMSPPAQLPAPGATPGPNERRGAHTWPSESTKSETQLGYIIETGGMFGQGIAGSDSRPFAGSLIPNDCPGSSKTVAQGLQYVMDKLKMPVALGTDWNALLGGPGPRFGPQAVSGLAGELEPEGDAWSDAVRAERWADASMQTNGVVYRTPVSDWRSYRFPDTGLFHDQPYGAEGALIWQALALNAAGADLTSKAVSDELNDQVLGYAPAVELALGLKGGTSAAGSVYFKAGCRGRDATFAITGTPDEITHAMNLVAGIAAIQGLWAGMTTGTAPQLERSTAGPMRDFDYNLDGLSHYGLLPDMLQDMKNGGLPTPVFTLFFGSAQRYVEVWERSVEVGAGMVHP